MGSGRFSADVWSSYADTRSYATKSRDEIFSNRTIDKDLDPKNFTVREARDSDDNPNSTPIIIAQDVTGSMGSISEIMARTGIPTLLTQIYDRKPVTDPQICCMAIGDIECDSAPVQMTQFEADIRISEQLEKFFLEGGGGGNSYESYAMAWWMAANRTVTDAFEKRGKKGYLFTIGDEGPTAGLMKHAVEEVVGKIDCESDKVSIEDTLTKASRMYHIFHVIVEQGSYAQGNEKAVYDRWTKVLGQNVLRLSDHTKLAEVIVSAIQVVEGDKPEDVIASWDGTTAVAVANAVKDLAVRNTVSGGVATL